MKKRHFLSTIFGVGLFLSMLLMLFVSDVMAVGTAPSWMYTFRVDGVLHEAGSLDESTSPYWWVNSGGQMVLTGGRGETMQGVASSSTRWRAQYANNNSVDTDNGTHPQNLFRLITKGTWQNVSEEIAVRMTALHMSDSPNRNASNGILLLSRYMDSANLYYAGIRVDGTAVIKKKKNGTYYTLAQTPVFALDVGYDRNTNPNLIPGKRWIGIKTETMNNADGTVSLKLFIDMHRTGQWNLVLEATDDGIRYGGEAFTEPGHGGLRTDFMDVQFDDVRFTSL